MNPSLTVRLVTSRASIGAALVVVGTRYLRHQAIRPDRVQLDLIQRATGAPRVDVVRLPLPVAREAIPVVLPEPRELLARVACAGQLDIRLMTLGRIVERREI